RVGGAGGGGDGGGEDVRRDERGAFAEDVLHVAGRARVGDDEVAEGLLFEDDRPAVTPDRPPHEEVELAVGADLRVDGDFEGIAPHAGVGGRDREHVLAAGRGGAGRGRGGVAARERDEGVGVDVRAGGGRAGDGREGRVEGLDLHLGRDPVDQRLDEVGV